MRNTVLASSAACSLLSDAGQRDCTTQNRVLRLTIDLTTGSNFRSTLRGTFISCNNSSSQSAVCKLNNMLGEALVTSVMCSWPPVKFQINQLSIVPKAICPASARLTMRASYLATSVPCYQKNMHPLPDRSSFVSGRHGPTASALHRRQPCAILPHNRIGDWLAGLSIPHDGCLARLVMPMAAMSPIDRLALARASFAVASCVFQISIASCSTQPGCG